METQQLTIETQDIIQLINYYDNVLNKDKSTYKSSNDEPTPMSCVSEMLDKIPQELWERLDLKILDPCCGNGNFGIISFFKLLEKNKNKKEILENVLVFNDINEARLNNVRNVFGCNGKYNLQITHFDYLEMNTKEKYDLIMANPPYARILENGKRASKNHNMIKEFIEKTLTLLKPNGYLLFITPDNWTSFADRNILIEKLTQLQIIHLDIHRAKKYFKKVGSSFTWYIIQNCKSYKEIEISGIWKKKEYVSTVQSQLRKYIPLLYCDKVQSILNKTIDATHLPKFPVNTSSDLHKYTKASFISENYDADIYKYKLIHTPSQTVYAMRPHKWQDGYKVFISTTDKYGVFVDNCGMTQSIAFILCKDEYQARKYCEILMHPLYVFINNICRWGNFNNIRILQHFPMPEESFIYNIESCANSPSWHHSLYEYFQISNEEIAYINEHL